MMKKENPRIQRVRIPANVCHEIVPNLFLGGQMATAYADPLAFDFIVSIGARSKAKHVENVHVGVKDDRQLDIQKELTEIVSLVSMQLEQHKRVLMHCKAGMNRSPSFLLAYLCKKYCLSIEEGMEFILSQRSSCKFSMRNQVALWLETQSEANTTL